MPSRGQKLGMLGGVAALAAAAAIIWLTRGRPAASTKVYCGPNGRLTMTAPIQSHRSYCLRAITPLKGVRPGEPITFTFDIIDDQGSTLREFAVVHEKVMHVIAVRHDLTGFQHVHPAYSPADGRFTIQRLMLPSDGPYRLFADFTPANAMLGPNGQPLPVTVPVDLTVGDERRYKPQPLPQPSESTRAGNYEVTLVRRDTLRAGEETRLVFTIRQGGAPVSDLEPYLGANGHAVILREGDLAFIHSHALDDRSALQAGQLPFVVHFAEPGRYRIFVQFQHQGGVRTAALTLPTLMTASPNSSAGGRSVAIGPVPPGSRPHGGSPP